MKSGLDQKAGVMEDGKLIRSSRVKHSVSNVDLVSTPLIIFDAPMGRLHQQTGEHIDIKIYIDTPADISFARKLLRDFEYTNNDKNKLIEEIKFYIEKSRLSFLNDNLKNSADLIMDGTFTAQRQIEKTHSYLNKRGYFFKGITS